MNPLRLLLWFVGWHLFYINKQCNHRRQKRFYYQQFVYVITFRWVNNTNSQLEIEWYTYFDNRRNGLFQIISAALHPEQVTSPLESHRNKRDEHSRSHVQACLLTVGVNHSIWRKPTHAWGEHANNILKSPNWAEPRTLQWGNSAFPQIRVQFNLMHASKQICFFSILYNFLTVLHVYLFCYQMLLVQTKYEMHRKVVNTNL